MISQLAGPAALISPKRNSRFQRLASSASPSPASLALASSPQRTPYEPLKSRLDLLSLPSVSAAERLPACCKTGDGDAHSPFPARAELHRPATLEARCSFTVSLASIALRLHSYCLPTHNPLMLFRLPSSTCAGCRARSPNCGEARRGQRAAGEGWKDRRAVAWTLRTDSPNEANAGGRDREIGGATGTDGGRGPKMGPSGS